MLTFQYRLYPSKEQQAKLWLHANRLNFLYNLCLDHRKENYLNKIKTTSFDQIKEITKFRKQDEILSEIYSQSVQQVAVRLDKSYQNFFRRLKTCKKGEEAGYPKYRACKNFFNILYPQGGFKFKDNIFHTAVYGDIRFSNHREIKGKIKQVSISNKNGLFFLNVCTDYVRKNNHNTTSYIAIDIGIKDLIVGIDSYNKILKRPGGRNHGKYFDEQIAKIQSKKDNLKKGSGKHSFLSKVIRKLYGAKVRKINDYQHKVSKELASKYDTIFVENLTVKKMSESNISVLNKSVRNAKFAQLISFLQYKANNVILVNPYNTSKTCNNCGKIHDIDLSVRHINCQCGNSYDRDENAAKNIRLLGLAILENGNSPKYAESLTIQKLLSG